MKDVRGDNMLSIVEAVAGIGRCIVAFIEALANIHLLFDAVHSTGSGFRWLCSPEYRKRVKEDKDYFRQAQRQMSIFLGIVVWIILLSLLIFGIVTLV